MTNFNLTDLNTFIVGQVLLLPLESMGNVPPSIDNLIKTSSSESMTFEVFRPLQHPVGQELKELLFSNKDFVKHYQAFKEDYENDLDLQFTEGQISPLKYYRIKKGITQWELAEKINDIQPHISRWENKKSLNNIHADKLYAIANALGIDPKELLNGHTTK